MSTSDGHRHPELGHARASWAPLLALAISLCGCPASPYRCDATRACAAPAVCAPTGYCAAPAPDCASGLRYTATAAQPGVCVATSDAAVDADRDVATDAARDATDDALDASADVKTDATPDIATDIAPDIATDAVMDVAVMDVVDEGLDAPDVRDAADVTDAPVALDVPVALDAPDARDVTDVPVALDVPDVRDAADVPSTPRCVVAPRPLLPLSGTRFGSSSIAVAWHNNVVVTTAEVQIARDPAFTSVVASVTGGGSGDARSVLSGLPRGTYFWRVRGLCGAGDVSDWSPVWSFWLSGSGSGVSPIGWTRDLNGDGRADLAIGLPRIPTSFAGGRSVDVHFGTAGMMPFTGTRPQTIFGADDGFGAVVALVPDMNGDGRADLAVSACPRSGAVCTPTVNVYSLPLEGRTFVPLASYSIGDIAQRFGADIAGLGDIDGDGYGDLLIAAPGTFPTPAGVIYVVRGGATLPAAPTALPLSPLPMDLPVPTRFGWSIAGVGDVTGDGRPDALVAAFQRAWIYPGSTFPGALFGGPIPLALTATEEGTWGLVASVGGDIDLDGIADFALARPGASTNTGDVSVYLSTSGLLIGARPSYTVVGTRAGGLFGASLAGGGNIGGTPDDDLLVGAPNANGVGEVYALLDRRPVGASRLMLLSTMTDVSGIGRSATIIGDYDGDTLDDFAFGWSGTSAGALPQSGVFTWRGSATAAPVSGPGNTVPGAADYGASMGER